MEFIKRRIQYIVLLILTIGLGLFSRSSYIPLIIYPYIGDVLYATMMYWLFACILPEKPSVRLAILSIGMCFIIELLQLYQADWIVAIRFTKLGGLILGYGFLWSDLLCYVLGGLLGYRIDVLLRKKKSGLQ